MLHLQSFAHEFEKNPYKLPESNSQSQGDPSLGHIDPLKTIEYAIPLLKNRTGTSFHQNFVKRGIGFNFIRKRNGTNN